MHQIAETVHVRMSVDQSRQHRLSVKIDDCIGMKSALYFFACTDTDNAVSPHSKSLSHIIVFIERIDDAIDIQNSGRTRNFFRYIKESRNDNNNKQKSGNDPVHDKILTEIMIIFPN